MSDLERVFVFTTFKTVRKEIEEYGKLTEIDELGIEAKLESQITWLKNKVQARQLRHAIMCFDGR
jgi:hypothetical protein